MIKNSLDLGSNSITNNVNAMSLALNAPNMMSEVNGNNNKVLFVLDMHCLES